MAVELLLVEDDPAHVELCRRVLDRRADEYRVSVAEDLASARAWLRAGAPDLVLADLRLPGGAATELLEDSGTFLPVVVMTSQVDQDRAVAAMRAGVLDYVVKSPEMFRALPEIIDRALRSARHVRDRIAAEAGLKESEERFRQLAENIDAVFWLYEVAGARLIYVSAAWERVFGTPVAVPLADPSARLGCVHADDRDEFAAHLAAPDPARPRQTCYRVVTPGASFAGSRSARSPFSVRAGPFIGSRASPPMSRPGAPSKRPSSTPRSWTPWGVWPGASPTISTTCSGSSPATPASLSGTRGATRSPHTRPRSRPPGTGPRPSPGSSSRSAATRSSPRSA